jgi:acetylserotonin N-methyltransferase
MAGASHRTAPTQNDAAAPGVLQRTPLAIDSAVPTSDLGILLERLGCELLTIEPQVSRYLAWSHESGLFEALAAIGPGSMADVCARTGLNEAGADSLLGVLCALELASRSSEGLYRLMPAAHDYFLRSSPFFMVDQLVSPIHPILETYLQAPISREARIAMRIAEARPRFRYGAEERLRNQHARNLFACTKAVLTGEFSHTQSVLDLAGGSGTFSIPFALKHPEKRITLTEVPGAIDNVRAILREHGLEQHVGLLGFDAFSPPWDVPDCDGIFIGNFLHGFDDQVCVGVAREAFRCLSSGGKIWLHEMIWNETRSGPLCAALLHARMRSAGGGRQRTALELSNILTEAGFIRSYVVPTTETFALIVGTKP